MVKMENDLISRDTLNVDVSSVANSRVRHELRAALDRLSRETRETDHFWPLFSDGGPRSVPANMLVCADLSHIVRSYQAMERYHWIARIRETRPFILAFIRTQRDEQYVRWADELVRSSDLRVSVCHFRRSQSWLSDCLDGAVTSLDPESVLEIRYSRSDSSLWIEFGDGLSGSVRPSDLGFDDPGELRLETAAIGPHPSMVQVLDRAGSVIDIDSGSIRALLDPPFARKIAVEAQASSLNLGERVRAQRLRRGVTQAQLAERTGLDQAILSKLERGKHQPRWDTIQRYAQGLELSPEALLSQDGGDSDGIASSP